MTDVDDYLSNLSAQRNFKVQSQVIDSVDADKKKAATATDLSEDTGIPPENIYGDYDNFMKDRKAGVTNAIAGQDKFIQDYILSHPMAAKVSKDDWGNISNFTKTLRENMASGPAAQMFRNPAFWDILGAAWEGMKEPYKELGPAPEKGQPYWETGHPRVGIPAEEFEKLQQFVPGLFSKEDWEHLKRTGELFEGFDPRRMADPFFFANKLPQLTMKLWEIPGSVIAHVGGEIERKRTGDEVWANKFVRDVKELSDQALVVAGGHPHVFIPPEEVTLAKTAQKPGVLEALQQINQAREVMEKAKDFVKSGEQPPIGIDYTIDQMIADSSKDEIKEVQESQKAATQSETRELNSKLFERLAANAVNQTVGLRWDAVKALYGDKLPEAGDGILGDVPDIQEQWRNSSTTGEEITMPMSHWLSRIDPEVWKALEKDFRPRPNAMNLKEIEELESPEQAALRPFAMRDLVGNVRAGAGLDPLFKREVGVPPEKLQLVAGRSGVAQFPWLKGQDSFVITDEVGRHVADLEITPTEDGKNLHIEWVGGYTPPHQVPSQHIKNVFGPGLMRDLIRQIRDQYPEAKTITGERVSGAREGTVKEGGMVKIDLDKAQEAGEGAPFGWDVAGPADVEEQVARFKDVIESGDWIKFGKVTAARIGATAEWTAKDAKIYKEVNELGARLMPKGVHVVGAHEIAMHRQGQWGGVLGAYVPRQDALPVILWSLTNETPRGTMRHEAIHFLRQQGFITREEWGVLRDQAIKENWIKKHNIISRYPGESIAVRLEESVAEEFRSWGIAKEAAHAARPIFERIKQLLNGVKRIVQRAFGSDVTADDLFTKIEAGEVGAREPLGTQAEQHAERLGKEAPMAPEEPKEEPLVLPGAIFTKKQHKRVQALIDRIRGKDYDKRLREAARKARQELTPEWKDNWNKMTEEVLEDLHARPDFKAVDFLQNGMELKDGTKGKLKLNLSNAWPYQKEGIPKHFVDNVTGVDPDQLGRVFGYKTGNEMLDDIVAIKKARGEAGPKEYWNKVVKDETRRRMEQRYGTLSDAALAEAREHVVMPDQLSLMHEETLFLADKLGQQKPLSLEDFRRQAWQDFNVSTASKQDLAYYLRESGKLGRASEAAWIGGDVEEAFRVKQQQVRLFAKAELAKKFQRQIQKPFDRIAKRYNPSEVTGIPQSHLNWVQDILHRVDRAPKRSVEAIQEAVSHQEHKTLEEFAKFHNGKGLPEGYEDYENDYNPNIPIFDQLYNPDWKKTADNMSVGEMTAIVNSLQSLIQHGRGQEKIFIEDRTLDLKESVEKAKAVLEKNMGEKPSDHNPGIMREYKDFFRRMNAGLMQMETLFGRWDLDDPRGFLTQNVFMPMIRAANKHDAFRRKFSRRINALKKYDTDLKEALPNDTFYHPDFVEKDAEGKYGIPPGGTHWLDMTRENLRAVLLNVGNESNLDILSRGFVTTPDKVMAWVHQHATEKDWKWAQEVGHIFKDLQAESDKMTMGMTRSVIPKIPLGTVSTKFGDLDGWYYPAIYNRSFGGGPMGTWEAPPMVRVMTDRGFERKRTGYAGPMDLHIENMADQIDRRLRDLSFRPIISEVSKILLNKEFQTAVRRYHGDIYAKMLEPWLRDVAGQHGMTAQNVTALQRLGEYVRRNIIGTLIGFNPGTLIKHTTTSFVQSVAEVGVKNWVKAMKDLYASNDLTMESNNKFIMEGGRVGDLDWEGSQEVQRRMQHWEETLSGATEIQMGEKSFRQKMLERGAMPVGVVDQYISKITWLAKYREIYRENLEKGMTTEEAHMDAVDLGDRVVRRTHGSTSVAARPEFMRIQGPIAKSLTSLYGFFNHIFNRYYRMAWMTQEIGKKWTAGEPIIKDMRDVGKDALFYVVAPIAVEQWMENICGPKDGWASCIGKALFNGALAPIAGVREVSHAITSGHEPGFGVIQSGEKELAKMIKDLDPKRWDKQHAGDIVEHLNTMAGVTKGWSSKQLGRWQKAAINMALGNEKPRTISDWKHIVRWGTTKEPRQ